MRNIEQSYGRINTLTEMAQDSTCFNLIKIRSLIALGFAMSRFKFKTGSN